jgi:hypothetical protein
VRTQLPVLFSEEHPLLTGFSRELFASLYEGAVRCGSAHSGHGRTDSASLHL